MKRAFRYFVGMLVVIGCGFVFMLSGIVNVIGLMFKIIAMAFINAGTWMADRCLNTAEQLDKMDEKAETA